MATSARANLSLPNIVEAAAAVLQRDGYAGLTMRSVAAELGVRAPALYWYFKNKQALELALYDQLMDGLVFETGGADWRGDIRGMAQALRLRLLAHRDITFLVPAGFFFVPKSMSLLEKALGVLFAAGLSPRNAFFAFVTCFTYVVDSVRTETAMRSRATNQRPGLDTDAKALIASGAFPHLVRVAETFVEPADREEQFLFGLNALIAGFERTAG
jgi:TetR/AcrR family tetracycline transcriptional repressor